MSEIRVGIDIGGTFTDLVFIDDKGNYKFGKTLTTYPDPSIGVLKGLNESMSKNRFSFDKIRSITHGTTLVTNALIERKGAKTALITTKGFRDQLEIRDENSFDLYDLDIEKPEPLVPRHLRITVSERVLANGEVLQELNEEEVKEVFYKMKDLEIEAVAVCLINSYANNDHEKRIQKIATEIVPEMQISISSEVSHEIREYERTSTTVANVYVQSIVKIYLLKLVDDLRKLGFNGHFHMMLSNGGTCSIETACKFPIRILESGPVGGTMAGVFYSELCSLNNISIFDMGGTTAKSSLIDDGKPIVTNDFEVDRRKRFKKGSGMPVKVPVVEMIEIGAGGGSIAYIDDLGLLKVGPESASSDPGPVCYRKGGKDPTVTDADLILGYLNPNYFLGGKMNLDKDGAYNAIKTKIADPLGISVEEAAWGIHRLVNENMANATRIHAVEKGKDIRNYPLLSVGGAGPVHACNLATVLDVSTVISPVGAGVCSAFGFLSAPLSFDFVRSYQSELNHVDWEYAMKLLNEMEHGGVDILEQSGLDRTEIKLIRTCDMRYVGQNHEINVEIPNGKLTKNSIYEIIQKFEEKYSELYSESSKEFNVEILNWRLVVQGPKPNVELNYEEIKDQVEKVAPHEYRDVYFDEYKMYKKTPIYKRNDMKPGTKINGPAIVEEPESTLVVTPNFNLKVDPFFNVILERN